MTKEVDQIEWACSKIYRRHDIRLETKEEVFIVVWCILVDIERV
jgi:hypothetical protein